MIEAQAEGEEGQHPEDLRPGIETVDPRSLVKIEEDVHNETFEAQNANCKLQIEELLGA
jgi:hypothetical protein